MTEDFSATPDLAPMNPDVLPAYEAARAALAQAEADLRAAEATITQEQAHLRNARSGRDPAAGMAAIKAARAKAEDARELVPLLQGRVASAQQAIKTAQAEQHRPRLAHARRMMTAAHDRHSAAMQALADARRLHARGSALAGAARAAGAALSAADDDLLAVPGGNAPIHLAGV